MLAEAAGVVAVEAAAEDALAAAALPACLSRSAAASKITAFLCDSAVGILALRIMCTYTHIIHT